MSNNIQNDKNNSKKAHTRRPLLARLFGGSKGLSLYEEEQIQSPLKTVIKTFASNKVGMTALILFVLIFATVTIGPMIYPVDLSYSEQSQVNVAPGMDLMKIPKEIEGRIKQIAVGPTFSVGLTEDGNVYTWGKTRITNTIDMKDVPKDMGKVVQIAVGFDHALAVNDQGEIFGWGNNRQRQIKIPMELKGVTNIKKIFAGYQSTIVLTEDGNTYFMGNDKANDYFAFHEYQGKLMDVAGSGDAFVGLTFDHEVVYLGTIDGPYARIPENMGKVISISGTVSSMAALNENGDIFVWGNPSVQNKENVFPEFPSKPVMIEGGRNHYSAILENGEVASWGSDALGQTKLSSALEGIKAKDIFVGSFQNYVLTEDNKVLSWGLKGYLCGTDELGRDIFTRLLNGGRMTMTIGGVSVVISTIIAIFVGGISGYFGGRIDNLLQRLSEIVGSLPFLPFAMILSALIGNRMTSNQKIFLIMIILGVLSWPGLQRLIRAQVLSVRELEYVTAARVLGVSQFNIVFKHIIPNVISIIIVSATLSFSSSMLTESSLSFLGFGVQAPQPTWGNMLNSSRNSIVIQNYWWRWVFASIVLSVCVICINLIGESLRDAIDPKSQER